MKHYFAFVGVILFSGFVPSWGQSIESLMPVPRSLCIEASLPAEMQRKLDQIIADQASKTVLYGQKANSSSPYLAAAYNQHVQSNKSNYFLPYVSSNYAYTVPKMVLTNSSRGHELVKGSGGKFNVKKDRLSSAIVDENQRLFVVNHGDELCDPSLFSYEAEGDVVRMDGNHIVLNISPKEIVTGEGLTKQRITVTHLASQIAYHFNLDMVFEDSLSLRSQNKSLAVMAYPTQDFPELGLVLDLEDQTLTFVQLPLSIQGEGQDGLNGRRGANGANGVNASSWTDKNGQVHKINGTCGKPGSDGGNGTDGADGGQFFIFLDSALHLQSGLNSVTAWIDAGKGGIGGKGGQGGLHGKGSGCSGKAPDGADGRNGQDGTRGDFLYVIGDVQSTINQLLP